MLRTIIDHLQIDRRERYRKGGMQPLLSGHSVKSPSGRSIHNTSPNGGHRHQIPNAQLVACLHEQDDELRPVNVLDQRREGRSRPLGACPNWPPTHIKADDPTPFATPGLRARSGRARPTLRLPRMSVHGRIPRTEVTHVAQSILVVLSGPCPRLQREMGFLQGYDAGPDRSSDPRGYSMATSDVATRPSWRPLPGRGCLARSIGRLGRPTGPKRRTRQAGGSSRPAGTTHDSRA